MHYRGRILASTFFLILLTSGAALAFPSQIPSPPPSTQGNPLPTVLPDTSGGSFPTPIQHVVVIVFENEELSTVKQYAPYLDYLAAHYGSATNFYSTCHGSLPTYVAMTSGETFGCENIGVRAADNIGELATTHGLSWAGYLEAMPTASGCDKDSVSSYDINHNAFLHYADIVNNASMCDDHVLNSAAFNKSVAAGTLPAVSFYIPNIYDDGHTSLGGACKGDTSASDKPACDPILTAQADTWVKNFLTPILNSTSPQVRALVKTTAFMLAFDEGTTNAGYDFPGEANEHCTVMEGHSMTACGGHVFFAVVSPYSLGLRYTVDATHYNIESTIEWLLGLPSDGGHDGTPQFPAMTCLFSFNSSSAST